MVDSGHKATIWDVDAPDSEHTSTAIDDLYRSMVNAELSRNPTGAISAVFNRTNNTVTFTVTVTNQTGVALSTAANDAKVHGVIYEDVNPNAVPKISTTSRLVRGGGFANIDNPLANNGSATFQFTASLYTSGVAGDTINYGNLHYVAMADYRPGLNGPYDMLNAAFATPGPQFIISPPTLNFNINMSDMADRTAPVSITSSSANVTWTASTGSAPWLTVKPTSGRASAPATPATIYVDPHLMVSGSQTAFIGFTASDGVRTFTRIVPVTAVVTPIQTVSPASLNLFFRTSNPQNPTGQLVVNSPSTTLTWTLNESLSWLSASPLSGKAGTPIVLTVPASAVGSGLSGKVTLNFTDVNNYSASQDVTVTVAVDTRRYYFLPLSFR